VTYLPWQYFTGLFNRKKWQQNRTACKWTVSQNITAIVAAVNGHGKSRYKKKKQTKKQGPFDCHEG